jgi:hypothetical protein
VVSIRGPGAACLTTPTLSCNAAAAATATTNIPNLAAGTYSAWVDGVSGAGTFNLTVTANPLPGTCGNPFPLPFTGGAAMASGTTAGTTAISGSCGGNGGPEQVYSFTQAATGGFSATVSPGAALRAVIYARSSCVFGSDLTCTSANAVGVPATGSIQALTAGNYFLVVDGLMGTAGAYTLTATQGPVTGESCSTPRVLALGAATSLSVNESTLGFASNNTPSCGFGGSDDLVFELVAPRSGVLTVSTTGNFDVVLSVRSGASCAAATESTDGGAVPPCSDTGTGTESVAVNVTAGTTYWIWVEGFDSGESGSFTLTLALP